MLRECSASASGQGERIKAQIAYKKGKACSFLTVQLCNTVVLCSTEYLIIKSCTLRQCVMGSNVQDHGQVLYLASTPAWLRYVSEPQ